MKIEKYILTALCVGVCIWSATMIAGVINLARLQGPPPYAILASLEPAAFLGAGLLPLLLTWRPSARHQKKLLGAWAICMTYVTLLALNMLRLGLHERASIRLALWGAIVVLLIRTQRLAREKRIA
jgi:hypothetical protein